MPADLEGREAVSILSSRECWQCYHFAQELTIRSVSRQSHRVLAVPVNIQCYFEIVMLGTQNTTQAQGAALHIFPSREPFLSRCLYFSDDYGPIAGLYLKALFCHILNPARR